jgi:hypothetical protein
MLRRAFVNSNETVGGRGPIMDTDKKVQTDVEPRWVARDSGVPADVAGEVLVVVAAA